MSEVIDVLIDCQLDLGEPIGEPTIIDATAVAVGDQTKAAAPAATVVRPPAQLPTVDVGETVFQPPSSTGTVLNNAFRPDTTVSLTYHSWRATDSMVAMPIDDIADSVDSFVT